MEIRIPDDLGDEERTLLVTLDFHGIAGPLVLEAPQRQSCPQGDPGGHDLWVFEFVESAGVGRYAATVCALCGRYGPMRLLAAA